MPALPPGLEVLVATAPLPTPALLAAAEHRDLHGALAGRARLPGTVIERCYPAGLPPEPRVAGGLGRRRLPARTLRHILRNVGEQRPEVLVPLLARNVPIARRDREALLASDEPAVLGAILDNPDWPVDEQVRAAGRADPAALVSWLGRLPVDVEVDLEPILGGDGGTLDADVATCLRALVRRPDLALVPWKRQGGGFRQAVGTVTTDERSHYRLLGRAQRLARYGRGTEAAVLIEAVAHNPTATLAVQRRARRLARRIPCPYLDERRFRPAVAALDVLDADGQRAMVTRLEDGVEARHRTVWSALLLALHTDLADDVRDRISDYLDVHLGAVSVDEELATNVADRLGVDAARRTAWRQAVRRDRPAAPPASVSRERNPEPSVVPADLHLADCGDPRIARLAGRTLERQLGRDETRWSLAIVLLRDGWEAPLAALPPVVAQLVPEAVQQGAA